MAKSPYLGGSCVNVGCVPKKLLAYGAHFHEDFEQATGFGWSVQAAHFDWSTLVANKNREISRLNDIQQMLLQNSGVTLRQGHARCRPGHTSRVRRGVVTIRRLTREQAPSYPAALIKLFPAPRPYATYCLYEQ